MEFPMSSLLASSVATTIDPDTIGWDVIDRGTWERLAPPLKLPAEAWLALVKIVYSERSEYRRVKDGPEPASQTRKDLTRLQKLACKLAKGLSKMGGGSRSALFNSLFDAQPNRSLLSFCITEPIDSIITDVERLRDHLGRAIETANGWHSLTGRDRMLRKSVAVLHQYLIHHTRQGLVRASAATKGRRGRATACHEFVSEVLRLIIGQKVAPATIDDAIKDVVKRQRSVGSS
jgi:hypothetical protein